MTRILLVDDHPVVRAGYQRLLEQDGHATVVAQAGSVDEAWLQYRRHLPDLTITDIAMPGSGGLDLLRRLKEICPDARVVVFSMHDSEMLVRRAIALGAGGFVSKSAPPEELLQAVRCVMSGKRHLSAGLSARLTVNDGEPDPLRGLSHREVEILRLIAIGESAAGCARALHLSPKTISNLQSIIKEKLGVSTPAGLVRIALRCGLLPADHP
jgi:DNA-binding NarL/FixJ family response regulator